MSFRSFLEVASGALNVAHVGATEHDSEDRTFYDADRTHFNVAIKWLEENDPATYQAMFNRRDDFVELQDGRDFLSENQKYDIVILHHLFAKQGSAQPGAFMQSVSHGVDTWKRRLSQTGARYIFTFGGSTEISGDYLGDVPGYIQATKVKSNLGRHNYSPSMTVYVNATHDMNPENYIPLSR